MSKETNKVKHASLGELLGIESPRLTEIQQFKTTHTNYSHALSPFDHAPLGSKGIIEMHRNTRPIFALSRDMCPHFSSSFRY